MDDLIAGTGVAFRALALPSFMDNLLRQVRVIKEQGMFSHRARRIRRHGPRHAGHDDREGQRPGQRDSPHRAERGRLPHHVPAVVRGHLQARRAGHLVGYMYQEWTKRLHLGKGAMNGI